MKNNNKPLTLKEVTEEMIRLLEVLLYRRLSKTEETQIKNLLKGNLEYRGKILHENMMTKQNEQLKKFENKELK